MSSSLRTRVAAFFFFPGHEVAVPAIVAPIVFVVPTALMATTSGRRRLAYAAFGLAVAVWLVGTLWRLLSPRQRQLVTLAIVAAVGLFVLQETAPGLVEANGSLLALESLVLGTILAWYAGLSAWLICRLAETAGRATGRHIARYLGGAIGVTAVVPALVFFALPGFGHDEYAPWMIGLAVPSVAFTLAVVPNWLCYVSWLAIAALVIASIAGWLDVPGFLIGGILAALVLSFPVYGVIRRPAAAQLLLTAGSEEAGKSLTRRLADWTRALFLVSASLAAAATCAAAVTAQSPQTESVRPDGEGRWVTLGRAELEARFAPLLRLDRADHWPISVCGYVLPATSAARNDPTNATCRVPRAASERRAAPQHDPSLAPRTYAVVDRSPMTPACARPRSKPKHPCPAFAGTGLVIEYWLFYDDDDWYAHTALGTIEQGHDADWEVVLVGLQKRGPGAHFGTSVMYRPKWIAYSSHCGGSWLPWSASQHDAADRPDVWVALGSHANYPSANRRSPNWASCVQPPFIDKLTDVASYSAAALETLPQPPYSPTCGTDEDPQSCLVQPTVVPDLQAAPFLTKLEHLGRGDWLRFASHKTRVAEPGFPDSNAAGVLSPLDTGRGIGRHPVAAIFGKDDRWHCKASRRICEGLAL